MSRKSHISADFGFDLIFNLVYNFFLHMQLTSVMLYKEGIFSEATRN